MTTTFSEDGSARARAIQSGEVSLTQGIPISQVAGLGDDVKTDFVPIPRSTYLHLNTKKGVFADPGLRARVAEVVDSGTVVKDIYEDHAETPKGSLFAQTSEWAKSVVSKNSLAGTTEPEPNTKIRLATWNSRPELPEAATVIADQLRTAGFDVEVVVKPYNAIESAILGGDFDVVLGNRGYGLGDAELQSASEIADLDERYTKAAEISAKIVADNAVIPIAHENSVISTKNLDGIDMDTYERKLITKDTKIAQ